MLFNTQISIAPILNWNFGFFYHFRITSDNGFFKKKIYSTKSFVLEFTEAFELFLNFNDGILVIALSLLARPWQELAQLLNYECDIWRNWKNIHYSKILNQPVILTLLSLVNTATILPHTVVHSQVGSTKVCRNFTCLLY